MKIFLPTESASGATTDRDPASAKPPPQITKRRHLI